MKHCVVFDHSFRQWCVTEGLPDIINGEVDNSLIYVDHKPIAEKISRLLDLDERLSSVRHLDIFFPDP